MILISIRGHDCIMCNWFYLLETVILHYERIWKDEGSGADRDGSFWRPVAPAGYVALGDVASGAGWDAAPSVDDVWCVRGDLVTRGGFRPESAWDDKGSGAASGRLGVGGGCWRAAERLRGCQLGAVCGRGRGPDTRVFVGPMRAVAGYDEPDASLALVVRK
ncbi:hypothetical protein HDV57DRAFT_465618 [Trichoderma longibrachiatum]